MFEDYATLNPSDGLLSINVNIGFKRDSEKRIKFLTTIDTTANIADVFASIFENKDFSACMNQIFVSIYSPAKYNYPKIWKSCTIV